MNNLKEIEFVLNEEEGLDGVFALSLVTRPAMEGKFIHLAEHKIDLKLVDKKRGILMGLVLEPEKRILRKGKNGEPDYFIYFSADTIRRTSEIFLEKAKQNNSTLEHSVKLQGNTVVESWIKEDEVHDKSVKFGLEGAVGSWIVTMKVSDERLLQMTDEGILNGFSIEGIFDDAANLSDEEKELNELKDLITRVIKTQNK